MRPCRRAAAAIALAACSGGTTRAQPPFAQGPAVQIADSRDLPDGPHYINDHTVVRAPDGRWHLYGIFHHEPAAPRHAVQFVHAVNAEPDPQQWGRDNTSMFVIPPPGDPHRYALVANASLGEFQLWAPHVARDDAGGRWVIAFRTGPQKPDISAAGSQLRIAVSADLYTWERHPTAPVFSDICIARDPMLLRHGGQWLMFYCRCNDTQGYRQGVAYRSSIDLESWSEPAMALVTDDPSNAESWYTESPFVFFTNGSFYLSVCAVASNYTETRVYAAADLASPLHFTPAVVTTYTAHAAEWVAHGGQWWMTSAGWGKGGVFASPMHDFTGRCATPPEESTDRAGVDYAQVAGLPDAAACAAACCAEPQCAAWTYVAATMTYGPCPQGVACCWKKGAVPSPRTANFTGGVARRNTTRSDA